MKICLLGNIQSIHLQRWAQQLNHLGHQVEVISFESAKLTDNIKIHQIKSKVPTKLKYFFSIPRFRKIIRAINPDLVHAHFLTSYGFIAACSSRLPLVVSAWGDDALISPQKNPLLKILVRFVLKKAGLVIIMASHMREPLIKLGCPVKKIIAIPLGVDQALIDQRQKINLVKKYNDRLVIINPRGLDPVYNVKLLVKAMVNISKSIPSSRCFIIGQQNRQALRFKKMVQKLNLKKYIHFLPALPHNQFLNQLAQANIYVSTSLSDGSSIALHEAMAVGLFPICTDIPANREWIRDRVNGFLVPTNDPRKLAQKILEAYQNKKLLRQARKINWQLVKEYAILDKNILQAEKAYQKLIRQS